MRKTSFALSVVAALAGMVGCARHDASVTEKAAPAAVQTQGESGDASVVEWGDASATNVTACASGVEWGDAGLTASR
jgi:hypothetical protein